MRYGGSGLGWGGWLVVVAMMVVFWGALAWVVVTMIRHGSSAGKTTGPPQQYQDTLRVLDERYARGEIDDDEYRRRRDVLRGAP